MVNNAYGLQCTKLASMINEAMKSSQIDFVVQSTDKNFMVPVGGSIVFSNNKTMIKNLNSLYPGRASASPMVDLFITLVEIGKQGWLNLLKERKETYTKFVKKLEEFAIYNNERAIV